MKKLIVLTTLVSIFALWAMPVLALDVGLDYGTYTGLGTKDIREGIMAIVRLLMGFLGIIAIIIMAIDVAAAIDKEEYGAAAAVVYTFFMGLGIPWAGFLNALQAAIAAIAPEYATHRFWSVLRAVDPIALGSIVPDMCVTAVQSLFSNHKEELAEELVARMRKAGAGIFVRFGEWLAEEMYDLAYPEEREGGTAPARVPEFRALKSYEYRH